MSKEPAPDQHLIDELYRKLKGEDTNGSGENGAHAAPGGSKLSDQAVLEKIFAEKERGEEFRDTYHGEYAKHRPDWTNSEAVASILRKAAFYSGNDPLQMERLIRNSALACAKFDEARGGSTWLADEIRKAIDDTPRPYQHTGSGSGSPIDNGTGTASETPALVKFREIERKDRPADVVAGLVPANSLTLFYGAGGVAKSYIALGLGMAVADPRVRDWLGFAVDHGPVVFADFELDATEHGWRSRRLAAGLGLNSLPDDLYYMCLAACKPRSAFDALYEACLEVGARLLIIDSITVALEGDVEVARDFIGFVHHQIGRLRKAGVATLALDHQGKMQAGERYQQKSAFGTSFKRHLSRSYAQLEPRDHGTGFLALTFRHQKQNFAPLVDPFGIRVEFGPKVTVSREELEESDLAAEETVNARERVYNALRGFENQEGTRRDIVEATTLAEGTVKKELAALKREERVWETDRHEGRQQVVTAKGPSGSGNHPYKGTGTGTASDAPLSADLQPGESATLEDLRERREQDPDQHPLECECIDCVSPQTKTVGYSEDFG